MPRSRPKPKIALVLALFLASLLPSTAAAQTDSELLITGDGVGPAVLGSTPDELIADLGSRYEVSEETRITVDFNGRVVSRGGQVQFRAAMTEPGPELTLFIVSNAEYATAEGVGPTTTIAEAERVYGEATLSWNPDNEGREFVSFENGPAGRVLFRTPGIGGNNVGIYPDDVFETNEYDPDGAIAAVWVSCVPGTDCPADTAEPEPTPTPEPEPTATPEPEATPTPEPQPTPTPAPPEPTPTPAPSTGGGSDGGSDGSGSLPNTGTTELVSLSIVSALFLIGGVLLLIERRYLAPAWLSSRR